MARIELTPLQRDDDGFYIEVPASSRILLMGTAQDDEMLLIERTSNDDEELIRIPIFLLVNDEIPDGAEYQAVGWYGGDVCAVYAQFPAVEPLVKPLVHQTGQWEGYELLGTDTRAGHNYSGSGG